MAQTLRQKLVAYQAPVIWFSSQKECCGLKNTYEHPEQLGVDRWAMAIGAWHRFHQPCLVVSAGTATTLDFVMDACFMGGCILPGLTMMRHALSNGTANLPLSEGTFQAQPRNTADAILSGCIVAQAGAIAHMASQLPQDGIVILTGGSAHSLLPHLSCKAIYEPHLALEGLGYVAQE